MGIQVLFDRKAALEAGAIEDKGTDICCVGSQDDLPVEDTYDWRTIEVNGDVFTDYGDDDEVMVDFNHWGSIRPVLEPWLINNNIPYREV